MWRACAGFHEFCALLASWPDAARAQSQSALACPSRHPRFYLLLHLSPPPRIDAPPYVLFRRLTRTPAAACAAIAALLDSTERNPKRCRRRPPRSPPPPPRAALSLVCALSRSAAQSRSRDSPPRLYTLRGTSTKTHREAERLPPSHPPTSTFPRHRSTAPPLQRNATQIEPHDNAHKVLSPDSAVDEVALSRLLLLDALLS